jgi:Asp-tRNA(Asn)/Glu-tRNA(Gln) amidotransferase A subunit family amidase
LCFGIASEMPVGIQVVGPRFADRSVLRLTKWLELARPFAITWPGPSAAVPAGGNRS